MKKVLFVILALGLLASVAGLILSESRQDRQADTVESFAAEVPTYMAIWRGGVAEESTTDDGYIVGKAVIVETTDEAFDWLTFKLPDAIQAETPEEVGTLIFLACRTTEVGMYENGKTARNHVCDMAAYDVGAGRVSYKNSVVSYAPESISFDQSGTAMRPNEKILGLIESLSGAE
jgi:hypothetical protein